MPKVDSNRRYIVIPIAAVVLLFSGYTLFYKLGNEPFQDYDEATYAQVTHESLLEGEPSGLSFLNTPYFRKPPLLFWMTTASAHLFKDTEFAYRFPSALAGFATVILAGLICIEAGAGVGAGIVAAAILATTAAWAEFARDLRFDNLVAFWIAAAFYAGVRALRDSRWFVMVGIMLALAVLTKSVMAIFGGIALLALLVHGRAFVRSLRDRYFWLGIGAFLLVAVPWHLYMTLTYGLAFWHSYFGTEVIERASLNLFPSSGNPTNADYMGYLFSNAAPWAELFVVALISSLFVMRSMTARVRSVFLAALITILSVLAVALAAKTKAFGYLMPLFPFLAVMLALAGSEVWKWIGNDTVRRSRAAILKPLLIGTIIVIFAYAAALTRYEALHIDPYYGWELGQAYEERAVGKIIRATPDPEVYAYDGYDFLGSIYYYSGLPDTKNPYVLLWSASSTPSSTSTAFILATSSLAYISEAFPRYRFSQVYSGSFVSLLTVATAP